MEQQIYVQAYDAVSQRFNPKTLHLNNSKVVGLSAKAQPAAQPDGETLYLSYGFIDSHAHVYDGATDLGVPVDRIGLKTGVHLVVDAGSAGSINFPCFRDYVMPAHQTPVKAFLNISRIGLVTKQPYYDRRTIDVDSAVRCIEEDAGKYLLGVKVLSSGLIVEDALLEPLQAAVEAARRAGCRIMAHLVEGPPTNEQTMAYLKQGDIISHCFHGAPNIAATLKASKGWPINPAYCSVDNVMWHADGTPIQPLKEALDRGVLLDVGHGAGSLSQGVARAAIAAGARSFSISTDAHIRNVDSTVRNLPHTMSKFMAFGMTLEEVVASVTVIPAEQLGLINWCDDLCECATIFRVRSARPDDPPFIDSEHTGIDVKRVIEPLAIIRNREFIEISPDGINMN